jgi:hypothetical protein
MSYLSRERGDFCSFSGLGEITRSKARSSAPGLSSTSTSRAVLTNRLNCSGLSGLGFGLRGMGAAYAHAGQSSNGNRNWRGSSDARGRRRLSDGRGVVVALAT